MRSSRGLTARALFFTLCALIVAGSAFAANPFTVAISTVSGDAGPGGTATFKATITTNDGSTVQSVTWGTTQKAGFPVTLVTTSADTITITMPSRKAYREELAKILEEQPIPNSQLPANVPKPEKFENGLQNRYIIAGVSNHALAELEAVFPLTVTTSKGTYQDQGTLVDLPWHTSVGIRNVAVGVPVVLHGKTQASWDWKVAGPSASTATLVDANTQNPEFTPDVPGTYTVTVTDEATSKPVSITIHAGTWRGIITGQDANGRPVVDANCTGCHVKNTPHFDLFTPWARSGHAEVFAQNVNTTKNHYGPGCFECHTVGYNEKATNGGVDEMADFQSFLTSGLFTPGDPLNWTNILAKHPQTARMANIQCENCHGPQGSTATDGPAHMKKDGSRMSLSSDVCGSCHGEPARHGRFQQWQLSLHADYATAAGEGMRADCTKCHSAQGFVQWANNGFSTAAIKIDWTADEVHPQTCQTCHDPHDVGTDSASGKVTNATVRLTGTTPLLDAGFTASNVGSAALCMSCHNGRRGLRDDAHFSAADGTRAPHVGPQADVLMGQNMYFTKVGTRGFHAMIEDSCVTCHMEKTAQPSALSVAGSGTNHTFYASTEICKSCHTAITAESVQGPIEAKLEALKVQIESALKNSMQAQIRAGNSIDLGGQKTVRNAADLTGVEFIESHGAQGGSFTLADGSKVADLSFASVKVVRPTGASVPLYTVIDPSIAKAGWNFFMVESDKSKGVHNPAFVNSALDVATFAVKTVNDTITNATPGAGSGTNPAAVGGGLGNGAGAVSCKTSYVYWAEIAGHVPGIAGSQWRTDMIARNLGTSAAALKFYLHASSGTLEGTGTVPASGQRAFEDLVATMGGSNAMGSLEICSDQPLLVLGRIFNQADNGTYGQNLDGRVADLGYTAGQTISLIGLRQKTDAYRSNFSVTNGGTTEAQVAVVLYDATGTAVNNYNVTIPAGAVVQEVEPFKNRANRPDVDWGFATVTVLKGSNILTSGSMVDMKTGDPTTIPAKQ